MKERTISTFLPIFIPMYLSSSTLWKDSFPISPFKYRIILNLFIGFHYHFTSHPSIVPVFDEKLQPI